MTSKGKGKQPAQTIATRTTPATLEAESSHETPSWMVNSPWNDPGHQIREAPEDVQDEKDKIEEQRHASLSAIITTLTNEQKKETVDLPALQNALHMLNALVASYSQ